MNSRNRKIVRGYVWSATTIGVVLGPGADAVPLAGLWVAGYTHLVKSAGLDIVDQDAASSIGSIVAGLGAWFISGKIAQVVAGALVAAGLTMAGATGPVGLLAAAVATLSLNSIINALFTYRFLSACAGIVEDSEHAGVVVLNGFINAITAGLLSVASIPGDLVKTFRLMFSVW